MGTESEALRWKQWIDRWIKISSPEADQNSSNASSNAPPNSKSDSASANGQQQQQRKSLLTTEQLRYQLVNMVKEGDPIFCEGLCRELLGNVSHFRLALKCLLGVETSEKARGFFCQIIFYLCKCPSPSVRKFLLSLLPGLLFGHFVLYSVDENSAKSKESEEEVETALDSIEIALLAMYQADMNYQPEPLMVRVPSLQNSSLYHSSMKAGENFPFNVNPSLIQPPSHLYPTSPIVKITDYTRPILFYRLCRSFQDFMPTMPDMALVLYSFWIERCSVGGTVLEDLEALDGFFSKQISNSDGSGNNSTAGAGVSMLASSSSNTLATSHSSHYIQSTVSTRQLESEDWEFMKKLVLKAVKLGIRTAAHEELSLLWTDCVTFVLAKYVSLGDLLRKQILSRARMELMPQVLMALE